MANTQSYGASLSETRSLSSITRVGRFVYWLCTVLLIGGIAVQVFLAGAGVLVNPSYWDAHRGFAHAIEGMPILILIAGLVARLPLRVHLLNGLFFLTFILQYVFLYAVPALGLPVLRGLHAANTLTLFIIAWYEGRIGFRMLRSSLGRPD